MTDAQLSLEAGAALGMALIGCSRIDEANHVETVAVAKERMMGSPGKSSAAKLETRWMD
jgi:hypothetical protein